MRERDRRGRACREVLTADLRIMMNPIPEHITADPDPLENLMHEHGLELNWLLHMENAAQSIETNGFSMEAFQMIAEAVRTIGKTIFSHSEREEQYLFPLIEKHIDGPTALMRFEHRKLWEAYGNVMKSVQEVEEGQLCDFSVRSLVQMTTFLVEYLTGHIQKENTIIYKMARRLLTTDEYQQLRTAIVPQIH
ncbi:MAG TPA: hemerythrin domain-containing protein [Bacteroidota bacterium]|nr:hemerythrin domain-containing protein [Bacteroidota bacterium]